MRTQVFFFFNEEMDYPRKIYKSSSFSSAGVSADLQVHVLENYGSLYVALCFV